MSDEIKKLSPKLAWCQNSAQKAKHPTLYYLEKYFKIEVLNYSEETRKEIVEFLPDVVMFNENAEEKHGVSISTDLKEEGYKFIEIFYTYFGTNLSPLKEAGISPAAIFSGEFAQEMEANKIIKYFKEIRDQITEQVN